jgi:hypothetical protein
MDNNQQTFLKYQKISINAKHVNLEFLNYKNFDLLFFQRNNKIKIRLIGSAISESHTFGRGKQLTPLYFNNM